MASVTVCTNSAPFGVHGAEVVAVKQRQRLQQHWPLAPGPGLVQR